MYDSIERYFGREYSMTLDSLIENYGYLAVLVGTFLEGETILILAGFAAHRGYIHLDWVITAAFAGSLGGDQLFFFLGRRHSETFLKRRPLWESRVDKVQRLLDRFRTPLILAFRFLYGFRTVTPFVIGMSSIRFARFLFLNAVGALVWAVAFGMSGYLFGNALDLLIGNIKRYEIKLFGLIAAVGAIIWLAYFLHRKR